MSSKTPTLTVRGEREIALLAIDRVSSFTLAFLAVFDSIAALTSQFPIRPWQYLFAIGAISLWVLGQFLITKFQSSLSFAPLLIYLVFTPVFVGDQASHSWISNGLNCIVTVIYFTGTGNLIFSGVSGFALAIIQYLIAGAQLSSNNDLSDIQYFHGYFSYIWIGLVCYFLIRIRIRYLEICDQIDEELEELRGSMYFRRKYLKNRNLRDYLNLQLHGTVLNSLIVLRNRSQVQLLHKNDLADSLNQEITDLRIQVAAKGENFRETLESEIVPNLSHRLSISIEEFSEVEFEPTLQIQLGEIYREILLNVQRHTSATSAQISLVHLSESDYQIVVFEDSPAASQVVSINSFATNAEKSKTLARLIKPLNASYRVSADVANKMLKHQVQFSTANLEKDPLQELKSLRFRATETLADGFLKLSFYYGLAILPGLIVNGIPAVQKFLVAAALISTACGIYGSRFRETFAVLALLFALLILPTLAGSNAACASIPALAWVFNGILASVFLISSRSENVFARWLPGSIFLVEALLTIPIFPTACNRILAGSTPGIIFIMLASFVVGRIRNQNLSADAFLSRQAEIEETNVSATESLIAVARETLLNDLSTFAHDFDRKFTTQIEQEHALNLMIQKIRAFLICSEFYEFEPARTLYNWVLERIDRGRETRVNIVGDGEFAVNPSEWMEALGALDKETKEESLVFSILNTDVLTLQITSPSDKAAEITQALKDRRISIPVLHA
jgi:hypothetical protein